MKHTFVLRTEYQTVFDRLTDQQAGALIKSIYAHVTQRAALPLSDKETEMAFTFIRQDLDFDSQKYEEICAKRAASGRKGGKAQKSKCLPSKKSTLEKFAKHNDSDSDSDSDSVSECESKSENITPLPPTSQGECTGFSFPKEPEKERLLSFAKEVLERFEQYVQTDEQKAIWLRKNRRCLRDIFNFCGKDTTLALQTISVCARGLSQAGLWGGYAAVCRNLPEYMACAQKELESDV